VGGGCAGVERCQPSPPPTPGSGNDCGNGAGLDGSGESNRPGTAAITASTEDLGKIMTKKVHS